jgi:hypothetical protein
MRKVNCANIPIIGNMEWVITAISFDPTSRLGPDLSVSSSFHSARNPKMLGGPQRKVKPVRSHGVSKT